jgi:hypothetical protein
MARYLAVGCLAFGAVVSSPSTARSAEGAEELRDLSDAVRVEPGHCIERETLVRRVAEMLRRREVDARVEVEVDARTTPILYRLFREGTLVGERSLEHLRGRCDEVADAVALAVAIGIDQLLLEVRRADSRPPVVPPPAPPGPPPPPPPPMTRTALPGPRLNVAAVVTAGVLPTVALGSEVGVEVRASRWLAARASGLLVPKSSTSLRSGSVSTDLGALALAACLPAPTVRASLHGCLGISVGRLSATADGAMFSVTYTRHALWTTADGRMELWLPVVGGLGLIAAATGFVPLVRPRLDVAQTTAGVPVVASRTLAPIGGTFEIGPAFLFR